MDEIEFLNRVIGEAIGRIATVAGCLRKPERKQQELHFHFTCLQTVYPAFPFIQ